MWFCKNGMEGGGEDKKDKMMGMSEQIGLGYMGSLEHVDVADTYSRRHAFFLDRDQTFHFHYFQILDPDP